DLAVDGNDVVRETGIRPGPKVGAMLEALLERVTDDPALNTRERLLDILRATGESAASGRIDRGGEE
ncbi:MAG TPA: polynucleotide adenylyltransferase, partial [Candidatus Krumholzibacteria bacterium]|nr:polynucleotide adenylyltransferase [Candidatus Krumholzibacteria bacterium]